MLSKQLNGKSQRNRKRFVFLFVFFLTVSALVEGTEELYPVSWSAKWIWQSQDGPDNSWIAFRKTFSLSTVPPTAIAHIATDTKYWMWINGQLAMFEGGAQRGPRPGNSWYDDVDIKPYLRSGSNSVAILVWHWGRNGKKGTHIDTGKGGLLFQASLGSITVKSDSSWKLKAHPAYSQKVVEDGVHRLPAYSVAYDARNSLGDWTSSGWYRDGYSDSSWENATQKGSPPSAPWGDLELNYVGALKNYNHAEYESLKIGGVTITLPYTTTKAVRIEAFLPFNKQITPFFEVDTSSGKVIHIDTDNRLNFIQATYTTKSGNQRFESYSWMNGHKVLYDIPAGVTVKALKYRWTGLGDIEGTFECSDNFYERLWWMGKNTLYVCARDNYMDCPDRERGLWIGDVADQAGYLFYVLNDPARKLLKKAIQTTTMYRRDGVKLAATNPGRPHELPSQSLQFISGAIWSYYYNTGDVDALVEAYPHIYNYLRLWTMKSNGMINYRDGNWPWEDWVERKSGPADTQIMQNCWYYMALKAAKDIAAVIGNNEHTSWYNNRINSIQSNFDSVFWKGSYYSSNTHKFKDDRANALSIFSGLASQRKYSSIVSQVLVPVEDASPHIEWIVEEAMAMAGYYSQSLARMKNRYKSQVNNNGLTTLYERFPSKGTYNHAWNAPNAILSKHIAGIAPTDIAWSKYHILPNLAHMSSVKQVVPSVKGKITVDITKTSSQYTMDIVSPAGTTALAGIPKAVLSIGAVSVNGTEVWRGGLFVGGLSGISYAGSDSKYVKFTVSPGSWTFVATEGYEER